MGWIHRSDEIVVSTRVRAGNVRAEYTGTFVDIFARDVHVDAFRPPMPVESQRELHALMRGWIKANDIPRLLAQSRNLDDSR